LGTVGWIGSDQAGDATSGVPDNAEAVLEPMSHGLGAAVTELAVDDEWFVLGQFGGAQK
jgi:hypothetical protein